MKNFVHTASLALCFSSIVASTSANLEKEVKRVQKARENTEAAAAYTAGKREQAVHDQAAAAHHKIKEKTNQLKEAVDQENPGVLSQIGNNIKKLGSTIRETTKSIIHNAENNRHEASAAYKAGKLEKTMEDTAAHAYEKTSNAIGKIDKKIAAKAHKAKEKVSHDFKALDKKINDTIHSVKDGVNDEIAKIKSTINDKTAAIRNERCYEIAKHTKNAHNHREAASAYTCDKITCLENTPLHHKTLKSQAAAIYSANITKTLQALSTAEEKGLINSTELRQVVNQAPIEHADRNALLASITARPLKCAATVTASLATTLYIAAVQKAEKSSNFDKAFKKTLNETYAAVSKKSRHAPGITTISSGLMTIIVDLACQNGVLAAPYSKVPYSYLH